MPKRGKQFFYASGQVSWPIVGLSQAEGVLIGLFDLRVNGQPLLVNIQQLRATGDGN